MTTYGLGIEEAQRIKKERDIGYDEREPQTFEQMTAGELLVLVKMKALRAKSFEHTKRYNPDATKVSNVTKKLLDELADIINYADMVFCKIENESR